MKVILDTNVLVSAIDFGGIPGRILRGWSDRHFELLASVPILTEYRRVMERLELQFPSIQGLPVLDLIVRESHVVEAMEIPESACEDPDDLKFLACAVSGRARCVVSGDRALLRASGFEGVEVLTPRAFAARHL